MNLFRLPKATLNALFAFGIAGLVVALTSKHTSLQPSSTATSEPKVTAPIADYAITPYTPSGYPKTFAKYGNRMPELESFRRKAAEKAASNETCDRVELAEISDQGTYSNMQFFVDCANETRFRFSESDLMDSNAAAVSEQNKALSASEAGRACADLIKANATHPSTVSINYFAAGSSHEELAVGNTRITVPFKAKNSFGTELEYLATCTFNPSSNNRGEITIAERS